jgi:hypothetical protein
MMAIADHIKRDPSPQESHHYNRAWEKVLKILTKAALDEDTLVLRRTRDDA